MALLNETSVIYGNKNMFITEDKLFISGSGAKLSFEDDLNTGTISYLPYGTGYNEVSLFSNSTNIEIGKQADSSAITKMNLYSCSLNIISPNLNSSCVKFNGWYASETYTFNNAVVYKHLYTEKAKIAINRISSTDFEPYFSIYLSDNTDPTTSTQICSISKDLLSFSKDLYLYNKGQISVNGSIEFERYSGGNRNLASRTLFIVSSHDNPYTSAHYYGESGLVIESDEYLYYDRTSRTTITLDAAGIGSSHALYRQLEYEFTRYRSTRSRFLRIFRPGSETTSNYWQISPSSMSTRTFNFVSPTGQTSYLGEPSWYNTGADRLQMNFTGQHRNSCLENVLDYGDKIGLIVVSCGNYLDFDNTTSIKVNQALPVVKLSSKRKEKSVYGVVSDIEDVDSGERTFNLNYWGSSLKKEKTIEDTRLIINSIGEGGIWITNINGNFQNGDLITTCEIPGYGMKQEINKIANYTVAKITCDCDFDLNSPIYICEEFQWEGQTYRRAFVGCTYHCG